MRQQTLAAQTGFEKCGRKSKREQFLEEMEEIIPWAELQALIDPRYPKGENGRPPVGLSIMLRAGFEAPKVRPRHAKRPLANNGKFPATSNPKSRPF